MSAIKLQGKAVSNRNGILILTSSQFSFNYKLGSADIKLKVNYHRDNNKSMHLNVMDNLHSLVVSGKVLYLGISDTPAWVTPFAVYQGSWNVMDRAFARDILPMAREHGMALCPWNILASGKLRSDAEEERREKSGEMGRDIKIDDNGWKRTPQEKTMSNALEKVAKEVGVEGSVSAVAIAYLLHKAPYVFPLVRGRKVEHMKEKIKALTISLSPEQIQYLAFEDYALPLCCGWRNQ
ncbi:NADP-dependent oxidoreductase domain-containing protein [Favolaschia claudopus]|uniref:NADP-dependent oxidoreductase domain-containing protein n=1 Tax=Favolaschia claudopus TaxID=2862362 RepID=A0AAV9ZK08_9AGAR